MEKRVEGKKDITTSEIEFYCDNCRKFLGKSEEYDNGCYEEIGKFEESFYFDELDTWYELKKHLCDKCKTEMTQKIKNELIKLGFKKD